MGILQVTLDLNVFWIVMELKQKLQIYYSSDYFDKINLTLFSHEKILKQKFWKMRHVVQKQKGTSQYILTVVFAVHDKGDTIKLCW